MGFLRSATVVALLAAVTSSGCAGRLPRLNLAEEIGEDSAEFALAYNRSANNQVLLNILQARDGLPRRYVTVSGISDEPSSTATGGVELGPLGLGNARGPFTASKITGSLSATTKPSYKVSPAPEDRLSSAVYAPIPTRTFMYFWETDLPRDVLFQLFVRNMEAGECVEGDPEAIIDAKKLTLAKREAQQPTRTSRRKATPALAKADPSLCRFQAGDQTLALDAVIAHILRSESPRPEVPGPEQDRYPSPTDVVLLPVHRETTACTTTVAVDAEQRAELLRLSIEKPGHTYSETGPENRRVGTLTKCPDASSRLALVIDQPNVKPSVILFDLRSLDQAVQFLGDEVRAGSPVRVNAPGWSGGDPDPVPLFRILTDETSPGWRDNDFAAVLAYRGEQLRAGMSAMPCAQGARVSCRPREQTATVMAILGQLYTFIPTEKALTPPTRFDLD